MVIEIKYEFGRMNVDAENFVKQANLRDFKALVRLANKSDKTFGTEGVTELRAAIQRALCAIRPAAIEKKSEYEKKYDEITRKYDPDHLPFEKKIQALKILDAKKKSLRRKFTAALKRLEKEQKGLKNLKIYWRRINDTDKM